MKPTTLFLRFALHCVRGAVGKRLGQEEYDLLVNAAIEDKEVEKKRLEEIFLMAVARMRENFPEEDIWTQAVISKYFYGGVHNKIVAKLDEPELGKDWCMVHEAEVVEINEKDILVEYLGSPLLSEKYRGKRKRKVNGIYLPNIQTKDAVWIHRDYACVLVGKE